MKIACTGSQGQIGRRLVKMGVAPLNCDILSDFEIARELHRVNPDVILHCAAKSGIDECEKDYELALAVNVQGTAKLCHQAGDSKVILLSSDQVFDGKDGCYKETDTPNPINSYGFSKLGAEQVARLYKGKIVRLSRCFSSLDFDTQESIEAPTFIKRNYCHLDYVAYALLQFAGHFDKMPDLLHYGGQDNISFFDFMKMFYENPELVSARNEERPGYSPRPYNCGFDISLAKSLLPTFSAKQSIARMKDENNDSHPLLQQMEFDASISV